MRDRLDAFGPDTEVALVTFTTADQIRTYLDRHRLPFTVLVDPEREAYRAYGLGRGSPGRVWGLRAARRYLQLIARSRGRALGRLRTPTEDTLQLGGDFVIGPDGTLAWGFWGRGPDDRPSIDDLVAAVEAARGSSSDTGRGGATGAGRDRIRPEPDDRPNDAEEGRP